MQGTPSLSTSYRPFGAFRFGLAMLVVLQHGLLLLAPPDRWLLYRLEIGAVAVAVTTFFALSGFIVAESASTFYLGRPGAFLANRMLRVVPPYLAALLLTIAVDSWLFSSGTLVPLDAPLQGSPLQPRVVLAGILEILPGMTARRVSSQDFSFIPFAWTLRVEFAFYLAAFATGCLLAVDQAGRWATRRAVLTAVLALCYAGFALFAWRHRATASGAGLQVICIPFFAFGLCLFLHLHRPDAVSRLHLLLVSGGVLLGFTYWGQRGDPVLALQLPLLCALFLVLAVLTRIRSIPDTWRRWDRQLGELSYPLYISHGVVLTFLTSISTQRGALPYCTAIAAALLLAACLHRTVEQPLRGLRNRLRGVTI